MTCSRSPKTPASARVARIRPAPRRSRHATRSCSRRWTGTSTPGSRIRPSGWPRRWCRSGCRRNASTTATAGSPGRSRQPAGSPSRRARATYDHGYLVFWAGRYDLADERFADARARAEDSAIRTSSGARPGRRRARRPRPGSGGSGASCVGTRSRPPKARTTSDGRSSALHVLGVALQMSGRPRRRPRRHDQPARSSARENGDEFIVWVESSNLSMVERQLGNLDRAEALSREALRIVQARGDAMAIPWIINGLAAVTAAKGELDRAATLNGMAAAMLERGRRRVAARRARAVRGHAGDHRGRARAGSDRTRPLVGCGDVGGAGRRVRTGRGRVGLDCALVAIPQDRLRNFSIIAHIDHGKSTLADRLLELTAHRRSAPDDEPGPRFDGPRAREGHHDQGPRGAHAVHRERRREYELNLIDTPGHVDFTYEVSRSLAGLRGRAARGRRRAGHRGADARQRLPRAARRASTIIPVLNKIDLPSAQPEVVMEELENVLAIPREEVILATAKDGTGVAGDPGGDRRAHPAADGRPGCPAAGADLRLALRRVQGRRRLRAARRGHAPRPATRIRLMASNGRSASCWSSASSARSSCPSSGSWPGEVGYVATGLKNVRDGAGRRHDHARPTGRHRRRCPATGRPSRWCSPASTRSGRGLPAAP